jgi:type III secretory pathway lipoprotein EscJ
MILHYRRILCSILLMMVVGCSTSPVMVPIVSVHAYGFDGGKEIIAILKSHNISAVPSNDATVVVPILVPKAKFESAVSLLRTNSLVTSGRVRLYTTIRWEE